LDEVACAFDDDGVVVGEGLLPSPQFFGSERDVGVAPDDECRQCREVGKPGFDVGEKAAAGVISRGKTADASRRAGLSRAFW
jgi:hypothetical protein